MWQKLIKTLLFLSICMTSLVRASDFGTADEAVAMVKAAIAYAKENGTEKVITAVNDPKGSFIKKDLYVVIHNMNGMVLANAVIPRLVGKNIIDIKDVGGKFFIKDRLSMLAQKNNGWNDFRWPNSITNQVENRSTYFERLGDLVFTCGILKK